MSNKDASKTSNGFIYQRMYAVLYFLDDETEKIIEEGKIKSKTYEDITIYKKDGKKITCQIKHHKSINGLDMSSDVYKTFSNENNYEMDEIIYIVSKYEKESFSKELKNFNNNEANEKYEIIKKKKENKENKGNKGNEENVENEVSEENVESEEKLNINYKKTLDLFKKWVTKKHSNI